MGGAKKGGAMDKGIMIIQMKSRSRHAVAVQEILTQFGCLIKTRLGIHDGVGNSCSDSGLIILELVGSMAKQKKLAMALNRLAGVKTKRMELFFK